MTFRRRTKGECAQVCGDFKTNNTDKKSVEYNQSSGSNFIASSYQTTTSSPIILTQLDYRTFDILCSINEHRNVVK